ncbi:recombinase family protein [Pseudogemmobacter sonorensis]|uniref:recombinase family protein n=1 Tax=Pseudogemmobacter sonorensis TaxID=2989681 RepID=UPI0036B5894A
MGVKAIIGYLNDRRILTCDGGRWSVGQIHAILTRTTCVGQHRINKRGNPCFATSCLNGRLPSFAAGATPQRRQTVLSP